MGDDDYLHVLKALQEIPFSVGKKLLIAFLTGDMTHQSIKKNSMDKLESFASLAYGADEIEALITQLLARQFIERVSISAKSYVKVLELTQKGKEELENPSQKAVISFPKTVISEQEKKVFSALHHLLGKFTDEQKKAIICNSKEILCVAGAGSGKTTVLTQRIHFLIKFRSVDPKKILAITFTRKARREMQKRLQALGHYQVQVETFNSFCEKILREHEEFLYNRHIKVITYRNKIMMINRALSSLGKSIEDAIDLYFTHNQQKNKMPEQLANIFMNDCFFLRDFTKLHNKNIEELSFSTSNFQHKKAAELLIKIVQFIEEFMQEKGLRDFADQLVDVLFLFTNKPELIPSFDHILIDEYQDVNDQQIALVDTIAPQHIFCVGDPRQSIYGWRGSRVDHILCFQEKYPACEVVNLTHNFRSTPEIVHLCNQAIKPMHMPDLVAANTGEKDIKLLSFSSKKSEYAFVAQRIIAAKISRNEIFVLARTNKELTAMSKVLKEKRIAHVMRSDEVRRTTLAKENEVTLATIHAIKGLEAELVFVLGATSINFPCKTSDHPVIDLVATYDYDKEEEERRLFYVALSRAKSSLYILFSGKKPTYFISHAMRKMLEEKKFTLSSSLAANLTPLDKLKAWRTEVSQEKGIPPYRVLHDRSLQEIAVKMPMHKYELEEVYGCGPTKVMRYGDAILKVLHGF